MNPHTIMQPNPIWYQRFYLERSKPSFSLIPHPTPHTSTNSMSPSITVAPRCLASTNSHINCSNKIWKYDAHTYKIISGSNKRLVWFLALLEFVSRATVVVQASVVRLSVRQLWFLGNRCMDPGQILWKTTYPPSPDRFCFSFFKICDFQILRFLFSFLLTWDPMVA